MNCPGRLPFRHCLSFLVLIGALFTMACDRQTTPPSDDVVNFTGTWTATGSRQTMQLEPGHQTIIFKLTGSLLLAGQQRPSRGFKADIMGFSDNRSGMQANSVWTDNHGDKVFSELIGEGGDPGKLIEGRFLGGTGRYTNVSGEYTFKWRRMTDNENGLVSGRVVDLKGWARLGVSENLPTTTGGQQ